MATQTKQELEERVREMTERAKRMYIKFLELPDRNHQDHNVVIGCEEEPFREFLGKYFEEAGKKVDYEDYISDRTGGVEYRVIVRR